MAVSGQKYWYGDVANWEIITQDVHLSAVWFSHLGGLTVWS